MIDQSKYTIELVRLSGEYPSLGQFSDIAYLGGDQFVVSAQWGLITVEPDGSDGFRVVETMPFDPPPPHKVPGAKTLVDIDADGRWEAITNPNGFGRTSFLYDEDGTEQWRVVTPDVEYPLLDALYPVQADHDPELELLEISSLFSTARLIQPDGSTGELLDLPYSSTYHVLPIDANGDGVDELLGAFSKHVALWSFEDGTLADLNLKSGRAVSFDRLSGSSLAPEDGFEFSMLRFEVPTRRGPTKRRWMGSTHLTLARSGESWELRENLIEPYPQEEDRLKGVLPEDALVGHHPTLWVEVAGFWTVVTVADTDLGLLFQQRLTTNLGEKTVSGGAGAIHPDSPAALEAWIVWMDGIWRLRVSDLTSGDHSELKNTPYRGHTATVCARPDSVEAPAGQVSAPLTPCTSIQYSNDRSLAVNSTSYTPRPT